MKKFISLLLALIMVMAMMVPAMAADDKTITIENANEKETYDLYKLFDLIVDDEADPKSFSYTLTTEWKDFFTTGAGKDLVEINEAGYVTDITNVEALAKAASEAVEGKTIAQSVTCAEGENSIVFEGLGNGYWLITSTLGTVAMTDTTPAKDDVKITEKNSENTIKKQVKEDSTGNYGESNDAQVGDTVAFQSTVTLNPHTVNVVVHDTMDSGLTLDQDSIAIEGLTKDTEYTVAFNTADGCDFEITFAETYLASLTEAKELVITYTAVLNENAVVKNDSGVAIVDQNNKTTVSYGKGSSSVEDKTTTTTHKFTVNKYADGKEDLAGAVFQLKKNGTVVNLIMIDALNYRVANGNEAGAVDRFTTVATGDIVIWGVDADADYTLLETEAPAGYNKLTAEIPVTVNANNSTMIDVENQSGNELPSTGGMGTTMMYIGGGLLVAFAVIMLATKRRMNAAD